MLFQECETYRARETEHVSMEAGPSTLSLPSCASSDGPLTPQTSGGMGPETTADADTNQTIKEEDKILVSDFYHSRILHVTEWSCGV